jgi:mono/diheme cytochrome c family protein
MLRRLRIVACALILVQGACEPAQPSATNEDNVAESLESTPLAATPIVLEGRQIFRFDTFGNEKFWTDTLKLHEVIETSLDPTTALGLGLKVDAAALPPGTLDNVDLKDPKTTIALLRLNAIVGVKATIDEAGHISRFGITCALCHSTVNNSAMPGIGRRLDGWPNRDLDVGAIIALSPELTDLQRQVYSSWGPGLYDPRFSIDGLNTPIVLPPAYGLSDIENETYTAEGPITYWNAYVAVTQMHGQGNFSDPQLGIAIQQSPDLVTPKLPALRAYQHSLRTPKAPRGSFNPNAALRGKKVFDRSCASCHVNGRGTDNNAGVLHDPDDTGMDGAYAARTTTKAYRTTPLRALWQHPPYFHDGSAVTLDDVVAHYNQVLSLGLDEEQSRDLVEYLKSL